MEQPHPLMDKLGGLGGRTYRQTDYGDESSMVLLDDDNLGDTIIAGNTDISGNSILESRYLVLSSLHIGISSGDAKYRI